MKASLLFAAVLAASVPAFAAEGPPPANRYAATIVPAERFEVGAMLVERHGKGGRPLVLIPGLASGPWVWQDMIREFSGERAVYVVTLPGFDGRSPVEGNTMDAARAALRELITSRKLDKPVLIGHSLGGVLSLAVAEDAPELVGGAVTIDGLPVLPGTEETPAAMRPALAQQMKARVAVANADAFRAQQQGYMRVVGVMDIGRADALAELTSRSDTGAFAQYIADTMALDLRPGLPRITAPVLALVPYFEIDAQQQQLTESAKLEYFRSLLAGTRNLQVASIKPSRHFAMIDQPGQVAGAVRQFLKQL